VRSTLTGGTARGGQPRIQGIDVRITPPGGAGLQPRYRRPGV